MERLLPSEEAARLLGVKVSTLYAYVSRGLLASHPEPGGRRSLFELADIERLATRRSGGRQVEGRLATITTGVTQLRRDGPWYRGRPATELASADDLRGGGGPAVGGRPGGRLEPPRTGGLPAHRGPRPDALGPRDVRGRRSLAVRPAARRPRPGGRRVIAALTDVAGRIRRVRRDRRSRGGPIALRLAHRLAGGEGGQSAAR